MDFQWPVGLLVAVVGAACHDLVRHELLFLHESCRGIIILATVTATATVCFRGGLCAFKIPVPTEMRKCYCGYLWLAPQHFNYSYSVLF